MHGCIYETNFLVDFVLNKKWRKKKKLITREKHPRCIAHGHGLAALMKKRKGEILSNKEQSTAQSTEQSSVQPTVQTSVQSTVQSNDT